MNPVLSAGLLIGVLCGAWTFVMGFTGWYKDPVMANAFFLVIPLEVAGLVWGLRKTAAEGRGYANQLIAGTMIAIVAGVVIIGSSLLFTTVAFPDYFETLAAAHRSVLEQQGKTEAEIAQALSASAAAESPMGQALQGFVGTLLTGILASAVIAIWIRAKAPVPGPAAHP